MNPDTLTRQALTPEQADLVAAATAALEHAYAPYSDIRVGAALRLADHTIVSGANIENSAYGSTLCAERSALAAAYAQGHRDLVALAVVMDADGINKDMIVAPCGACRQMLHEAACSSATPMQVILSNPRGERFVITDMDELLPLAFGPPHLER